MRDVVAWGVLRVRTWLAFAAAFVATNLASGDGKGAWTVIVGLSTFSLAALSVWAHYLDEHPDRARGGEPAPHAKAPERPSRDRRRGGGGHGLSREEAMAAEILRRYEEEAAARRASSRETGSGGGGTERA